MSLLGLSSNFLSDHLYKVFLEKENDYIKRILTIDELSEEKIKELQIKNDVNNIIDLNESCHNEPGIEKWKEGNEVNYKTEAKRMQESSQECSQGNDLENLEVKLENMENDASEAGYNIFEISQYTQPSPHSRNDSSNASPVSPTLEDGTGHPFSHEQLIMGIEKTNFTKESIVEASSNLIDSFCTAQDDEEILKMDFDQSYALNDNDDDDFEIGEDAPVLTEKELIQKLDIWKKGSVTRKLQFLFNIFDIDREGIIRKESVMKILKELYDMLGDVRQKGYFFEGDDMPKGLVALMEEKFDRMDTEGRGFLLFQEYEKAVRETPEIQLALGINFEEK